MRSIQSSRTDHGQVDAVYNCSSDTRNQKGEKAHHKFLFGWGELVKVMVVGMESVFLFLEGSDNAQANQAQSTAWKVENLEPSKSISLHSSRPLLS